MFIISIIIIDYHSIINEENVYFDFQQYTCSNEEIHIFYGRLSASFRNKYYYNQHGTYFRVPITIIKT